VFGHEGSAVVLDVGDEVTTLRPGDRVAILPNCGCGRCMMCRAGLGTRCTSPTGWMPTMETEQFVAPERACFRIPDEISDVAGACIESLSCGLRAVRSSGIALGDQAVVFGGDDYAFAAAQASRLAGARVILADPLPVRRAVAERLGLKSFDPEGADFVATMRELMPWGADHVFLSQENYLPAASDYFRQACEVLRIQGTVNILRAHSTDGIGHYPAFLPWSKEITVRHYGVFFGEEPARGGRPRGDFQVTIDAVARGQLDGEAHVTHIAGFDDIRSKSDMDDIYARLPEAEAKILFRISR
jgi:threonine dehydrogenase-like Zn-dependent dehydrogenase